MSVFRLMPAKSNTVASGAEYKQLNSSQNPVADLWYGGSVLESGINRNSISRHLIYFDLSDLQSKMTDFTINSGNVTSYKLKLKNCLPSSKILTPEYEFNILNKTMAHSFDLIAFPIDKFWDEGRGYDLDEMHYIKRSRGDIRLEGVSNWLSATTTTPWTSDGILDNPTASTSNYATQHFSTGAEDINMDITAMVNSWLSGGSTNYGLCLAYARPFELTSSTTRYIASFFTHKTNSSNNRLAVCSKSTHNPGCGLEVWMAELLIAVSHLKRDGKSNSAIAPPFLFPLAMSSKDLRFN